MCEVVVQERLRAIWQRRRVRAPGMLEGLLIAEALGTWVDRLYERAAHDGLEGKSPLQVWEADRSPLRHVDPVRLSGAFLLRVTRRVDKTALIRLRHHCYLCSDALRLLAQAAHDLHARYRRDRWRCILRPPSLLPSPPST